MSYTQSVCPRNGDQERSSLYKINAILCQHTLILEDILGQLGGTPATRRTVDFAFGVSYALPAGQDFFDASIFSPSGVDPLYVLLFISAAPPVAGQAPQFVLRTIPGGHVYYEATLAAATLPPGQSIYLQTSTNPSNLVIGPETVFYAVSRTI